MTVTAAVAIEEASKQKIREGSFLQKASLALLSKNLKQKPDTSFWAFAQMMCPIYFYENRRNFAMKKMKGIPQKNKAEWIKCHSALLVLFAANL